MTFDKDRNTLSICRGWQKDSWMLKFSIRSLQESSCLKHVQPPLASCKAWHNTNTGKQLLSFSSGNNMDYTRKLTLLYRQIILHNSNT